MDLFGEKTELGLPQSDITYFPRFFSQEHADTLYKEILDTTPWQHDKITLFGKTYDQPRLTALYGENEQTYSYSGITMHPQKFTAELQEIKTAVEDHSKAQFNTCLVNLYRNGKDSNGWHSDDEKELGQNPIIASVSLGAPRFFHLRNKSDKALKHKLLLEHGSLLLMKGTTQHHWQHQIPKTAKPVGSRINLTFRILK